MMNNRAIEERVRNTIPWIVWYLWKYRNRVIFEGKKVLSDGTGFENKGRGRLFVFGSTK